MNDVLKHYGTPRHSGRYPWGSGEDPQRSLSFLQNVAELKKKGLSEKEIARGLGIVDSKGEPSTSKLRAQRTIARAEVRKSDVTMATHLKDKGYSTSEIGRRMGKNESSIRSLLDPVLQERSEITRTVANMLKDNVEEKKYIDVGLGIEQQLGVSRTRLKASLALLEEEGYKVHKFDIEQVGTGKPTNMMVLTKEDVGYGEVRKNANQVRMISNYSDDGGRSMLGIEPPRPISANRIKIRYGDQGGVDKDGVIELRRGVDELSLGTKHYAQVRISVDGTHYLKGMAIYAEDKDFPKGVDIIYNTNKKSDTPPEKVFKAIKDDPDNPFGSVVRQKKYIDADGKEQLSALNIVGYKTKEGSGEEGSWGTWSKTLSSQVLSKQLPSLAKKQLGLAYDEKQKEFDEIMALTNPAVRKKLLDDFSDDCDSSAVHLKAAALPRQQSHVLLPLTGIKETEIYAPNYDNGEKVVLIRYPHGGIFEIPELTVNNKNPSGVSLFGPKIEDAVGIHPKVAEKLSGADFDGDTALVIPNNSKVIKTSPSLKALEHFDPKELYKLPEGAPTISSHTKQQKMGDVSNLITDMTIKGASPDEIARAVKHSMVVIDSEKHHLDYKKSYIDNGIAALKKKYQGRENAGASTLVSRASSEIRIDPRKELTNTKKMTPSQLLAYNEGKKVYVSNPQSYTVVKGDPKGRGKVINKTIKSSKMAETDDAFTLSSGTQMETVYATHANKLKALANEARRESRNTPRLVYSPSAKITYAKEVTSLNAKLNLAIRNKPFERQAHLLANSVIAEKKRANPNMEAKDLKKIKGMALTEARTRVGANKEKIVITDREWEAIQAGAISNNVLAQILNNTDMDSVKRLATPRTKTAMTTSKVQRARTMLDNGKTRAEVAEALGVSVSTLNRVLKE